MTPRAARTAILARVRHAQRTAVLPPPVAPAYLPQADESATDTLPRFARELEALGVEVHQADSSTAARDLVRSFVDGRRILSWDRTALPHGIFDVLPGPLLGSAPREQQAAAEIGVTSCDAAVADTGSLVLLSGAGRARTVSLLPSTHLAIVSVSDVVRTLADAFARLQDRMRSAASCTVITGPSRTADIELTLTLGIHGPGRVVVVIAP